MGLVTKLAVFAKRVFPEKFLANLDHRLESTKIAFSAEEYVGVSMIVAIVACVVVGFLGVFLALPIPPLLLVPITAVGAFLGLILWVPRYMARKRADELERMLPDALRQMASTLRAGVGIDATLEDISKSKYGALSDEFDRVVTEVKRGRTLESAMLALARRSSSALYERAFRLIVEGIERGAALASVLDAVAGDIKEVHTIQRERQAATMQQIMFLFAVSLFAAPFIVGLVVGVGGIKVGDVEAAAGASQGLPPEMTTIAQGYIIIQAFICGLAVGVIRYGQMSKGLGYSIAFMIASTIVFSFAQMITAGLG